MSNTLATSSLVAKEALAILRNSTMFAQSVNREWEDEFGSNQSRGYSPGATINIKRPPRYQWRAGRISVPQPTVETTTPLVLSQGGCDLGFNIFETTLTLQQKEKKIEAAVATIVNEIDRQGLELARYATFNTINPTGALPTTQLEATKVFTNLGRRLTEMGAPVKDRSIIMGPGLNAESVAGLSGLFNPNDKLSQNFKTGMMGNALGFDIGMDQNVTTHTNGAATATNINGAGQTGSAITVVAIAGGTLTKGTAITLPGVFAVNPQSRQSTGVLAQFVVTADALVGATTINVSPALVTSGAFQNVTASPTTGSPYVIMGAASTSYQANIAYHKDAFTLAMVPLVSPGDGLGAKVGRASEDGFNIKVTTFYDGINDNVNTRLDVLFGYAATYPELAARYFTV